MQDDDYDYNRTNRKGLNWLPVLMLFLALLFAWGIYSTYDNNRAVDNTIQQEFGIGGAPEVNENPTATPLPSPTEVPSPTDTILNPSIEEDISPTSSELPQLDY